MEDWDLQAVVRGCTSEEEQAFAGSMNHPLPSLFAPLSFDDLFDFPQVFESTSGDFGGIEGLYKPFYPVLHQQSGSSPICNTTTATTSMSCPCGDVMKDPQEKPQKKKTLSELESAATSVISCIDSPQAAKPRKLRKNQQRVVQLVKGDGRSTDMWAWRKYGQKPIKGSPYPRSYYRCSSLKGCLARKQVERSSSDPSMFIITYTAEHSHAHPTRRNSLAGSTRAKSTTPKQSTINEPNVPIIKDECSLDSHSMASIEDEFVKPEVVSTKNEEQQGIFEKSESQEITIPDLEFSDEMFPSLGDLEGLFFNQFAYTIQ